MSKWIDSLNVAYGLDSGGYSFEPAPKAVGKAAVVWDDPDWDCLPCDSAEYKGYSCLLVAFAPNSGHFPDHDFPDSYTESGASMVKVGEFRSSESERECHCQGKLVEWFGAAGEPPKPLGAQKVLTWVANHDFKVSPKKLTKKLMFLHTGNTSDQPFPDCTRCSGSGYVTSPGGEWAVYALDD